MPAPQEPLGPDSPPVSPPFSDTQPHIHTKSFGDPVFGGAVSLQCWSLEVESKGRFEQNPWQYIGLRS